MQILNKPSRGLSENCGGFFFQFYLVPLVAQKLHLSLNEFLIDSYINPRHIYSAWLSPF